LSDAVAWLIPPDGIILANRLCGFSDSRAIDAQSVLPLLHLTAKSETLDTDRMGLERV
jgi:hypothetical protein